MVGLGVLLPTAFWVLGKGYIRPQQFLVSCAGAALDDTSALGKLPMAGSRRRLWYQGVLWVFCSVARAGLSLHKGSWKSCGPVPKHGLGLGDLVSSGNC